MEQTNIQKKSHIDQLGVSKHRGKKKQNGWWKSWKNPINPWMIWGENATPIFASKPPRPVGHKQSSEPQKTENLYFPLNPGCLIGILLIMVYYNPHLTV